MTEATPDKTLTYPIGNENEGGALFLFGDTNSPNITLLCGGYPDDHQSFTPLASRLASEANCLAGVACLPGYDHRPPEKPYTSHCKEGYTFDQMVASLRDAAKVLRAASTYRGTNGETAKYTAIFHDWGCSIGTMYVNRTLEDVKEEAPKDVVLFDICPPPHPDTKNMPVEPPTSWYKRVVEISYRIALALSFVIRRYVSKYLAMLFLIVCMTFLKLLRIGPTLDIDAKVFEERDLGLDRLIYMAYPYTNLWMAVLKGTLKQEFYGYTLPKNLEEMPLLYLYGTEKRIMFHNESEIKVLEREAREGRRSNAIAVDGAGHWLYLQQPELCFTKVKNFIQEK